MAAACEVLREKKTQVLEEWEVEIRRTLRSAQQPLSSEELRDNFPALVDSIIESLEAGDIKVQAQLRRDAALVHAAARYRTKWDMPDLISEYRILRRILFDTTDGEGLLSQGQAEILSSAMFDGMADSAIEFAKYQVEDERSVVDALKSERQRADLFVATLTHDMRQPLSALKMALQILIRQPDMFEMVHRAHENAKRLERMITDLLDVAQVRAGKMIRINPERGDVGKVIQDVVNEYASAHGDRFVTQCGNEPAIIECDPRQLRRAIENLINNALKYGWQHTRISINCDSTQRGGVAISVENFGPGIPSEELTHIFEPFERARLTASGQTEGWGLGLALVRAIVEAHGGTVSVQSDQNKTSFSIELPQKAAPVTT